MKSIALLFVLAALLTPQAPAPLLIYWEFDAPDNGRYTGPKLPVFPRQVNLKVEPVPGQPLTTRTEIGLVAAAGQTCAFPSPMIVPQDFPAPDGETWHLFSVAVPDGCTPNSVAMRYTVGGGTLGTAIQVR